MDGMSKTVGTSARHFFRMTRGRAGLAVLCPEDGIFTYTKFYREYQTTSPMLTPILDDCRQRTRMLSYKNIRGFGIWAILFQARFL
jgi:hypothetical protein